MAAIDISFGHFIWYHAPLEYSGATCQHGCAYCFATSHGVDRKHGLKSAANFLYNKNRSTYADALLVEGYPICISNRSDPFSPNNLHVTEQLFSLLKDFKNGVMIQTKGNKHAFDLIEMLGPKKAVVYISCSIWNEKTCKTVEPGAPTAQERIELMERLRAQGYHVICAINPLSETWLPVDDFIELTDAVIDADVNHFFAQPLHTAKQRLRKFNIARISRLLGAEAESDSARWEYNEHCVDYLQDIGCVVGVGGGYYRTTFYRDIEKVFRCFPVMDNYWLKCFDDLEASGKGHLILTFDDFYSFMSEGHRVFHSTFNKQSNLKAYLLAPNLALWQANQNLNNLRDLTRVLWNYHQHRLSIKGHPLLYPIVKKVLKVPVKDDKGNLIYYFDGTIRQRKEVKIYGMEFKS